MPKPSQLPPEAAELISRWRRPPWSTNARAYIRPLLSRVATAWHAPDLPRTPQGRVDLRGIVYSTARLDRKFLQDVDLSYARLGSLETQEAILRNVQFSYADLSDLHSLSATFQDCVFDNVSFENWRTGRWKESYRPTFENCFFNSCSLRRCSISDAVFRGCRFTEVTATPGRFGYEASSFVGTRFEHCTFERCVFRSTGFGAHGRTYDDGGFMFSTFSDCVLQNCSAGSGLTLIGVGSKGNTVLVYQKSPTVAFETALRELGRLGPKADRKWLTEQIRFTKLFKRDRLLLTKEDLLVLTEPSRDVVWRVLRAHADSPPPNNALQRTRFARR